MDQFHNPFTQGRTQAFKPILGRGVIQYLALLDQWTDPIGLLPLGNGVAQFGNHLINAIQRYNSRGNGFSPGRFFIQNGNIHIPILRKRQRTGNGCCGHHQNIDGLPLLPQFHALTHAKTVLFINNGKPQILKFHITLENGMCADQNMNIPTGKRGQFFAPFASLIPPCQQFNHHLRILGQGGQCLKMLACKDFGRGHQNALPAIFDRD